MRLPHEVEVYLWRRALDLGIEVLLLRRSAEKGGFWHCVAGAVEPEESEAEAAARELREETGLTLALTDAGFRYAYPVDDDRRHLFAPGTREITVTCFSAEVLPTAEIRLDWEHDELAWHPLATAADVLRFPVVAEAMARVLTPPP